MPWVYLALAIAGEIIGTSALKATEGFTKPIPIAITIAGYATAFYFLALTLKTIPVGVAYAIWSGVGVVAIGLIGYLVFKQTLDWAAVLGMALIVAGVLVMNVFSKSLSH